MTVPVIHNQLSGHLTDHFLYRAGSVVLFSLGFVMVMSWPRPASSPPAFSSWHALLCALGGTFVAGGLAYWTASRLLPAVFAGPVDVNRADMLVVIEAGVRRFVAGQTPYVMYEIPWSATLPYGPILWLPYVLPVVAHADLRILTLTAHVVVIAACMYAAAASACVRQWVPFAALGILGVFWAWHPYLANFHPIGHTQVYWPLIIVFVILLRFERWTAAAVALGLLVAARTTMVSLVPVFLIAAYHRGHLSRRTIFWLLVTSAGPFVPFLVIDPRSVIYAMYGSYQVVIKQFVWTQTVGATTTYGVTGPLLERHLNAYVELLQLLCLSVVYVVSWRPLSNNARPEPWLALALLVFSMTTLWPVLYLYFDVWILCIAGLLSISLPAVRVNLRHAAASLAMVSVVGLAGVFAAAARRPGASYSVDIGTPASAPLTGGGFGRDEASVEGERTFVWVEGGRARVRLPRAGWSGAAVHVEIRPYEPVAGLRQTVSAALNSKPLGSVALQSGWQDISFNAPGRMWTYGFNVLDLYFSYSLQEPSPSTKAVSAAIDRVTIQ